MTVDIDVWMPLAVVAGVTARILFRRGHWVAASAATLIGPVFLCLYAVIRIPSQTAIAALLSVAWLVAAGLSAFCMFLFYYTAEKLNAGVIGTSSATYSRAETPKTFSVLVSFVLVVALGLLFVLFKEVGGSFKIS